jgi:hypothetical protein
MPLIDQKTEVIEGYSYEIVVSQGTPVEYVEGLPPDPKRVYLDVWVIDEVNGITHDHQTFELTDYIRLLTK